MFAFLFSIFSALNFLSIKSIGANIHPSLKTFYFALFSTIIFLMVAAIGADTTFFKIWLIWTDP
jgi:hypothetical protein